jgi:hypothetical protein
LGCTHSLGRLRQIRRPGRLKRSPRTISAWHRFPFQTKRSVPGTHSPIRFQRIAWQLETNPPVHQALSGRCGSVARCERFGHYRRITDWLGRKRRSVPGTHSGTHSPIRFQRMTGNFEWRAQPGNPAANTKIGKVENVNPNDQCLAPIRRFDSSG